MKFALLLASGGILATGCAAHAHVSQPPPPATVEVSIGWTWIDAHWSHGKRIEGHWLHPHYGKSYRNFHHGPPAPRPNTHASWVPGHHKGKGRNRHWVPGHWKGKRK